ncbi:ROK family transcriptional regulator [Bifidobacterium margollesii]|uniref:ROK family transcriptional regulator n=1 Tax=Bifidobacterium margollesii TaxID=2020964 RepID=A0A2N5JD29_9BIFI|nr:ROK family protein [Bifidobacterium margollesii]PLS32127.1 ROK family transcriptional regulator [Bifidobacterium margollesii]
MNSVSALPKLRLMGISPSASRSAAIQSDLCLLIASGKAPSKAALGRETGLPRTTISSYISMLMNKGILASSGVIAVDRGRPAEKLMINRQLGLLLIADLGARHANLAIADLNMNLLDHERLPLDVSAFEPREFLTTVCDRLWEMASESAPELPLRHCVLCIPARIDSSTHEPFRPPIMRGWDMFNVSQFITDQLGCPVTIENDVNLRALGEAAALEENHLPLIAVKIATGVGGGIIDESGRVFHGFDGSAGEIGHTCFDPTSTRRCACGKSGCLEASVSVPAMLETYRQHSGDTAPQSVEDLIDLLRAGDETAQQVVSEAGERIGQAIAFLCNVLNPRRVIVTGLIVEESDEMLTEIRTSVYKLARPLSTRNLSVKRGTLRSMAGVAGGIVLGTQRALSPELLFESD